MKQIIKILLLLIPIISLAQMPSQQLANMLANFRSMQADFSQKIIDAPQPEPEIKGKMALQRPGKFRWQIETPDTNKQLIIADGINIWIYDINLEQVIKEPMNSKYTINPAILLSGSSKELQNNFIITRVNTKQKGVWFELKPVKTNAMFQKVQLQFINSQLQSMHIVDNMGVSSSLIFTNIRINQKLNSALFKFTVPAGVDVIQNSMPQCDPDSGICPIPLPQNE